MSKFTHFIFYNNTIPIVLGVLFLGAGATFAASPQARESIVNSETALVTVDNSYLLNTTIDDSTVTVTVGSVTEDSGSYYIEYQVRTLGVRDGAWQPIVQTKTLVVSKDSVVGRDLGLYAEEEIAEVHAAEVRLLKETQASERRGGITPKVVTTEYDGLVGQFFDPNQEVFPQYNPTIDPSVGVPLTSEQERAHEAVRRLLEEAKKKEEQQNQPDEPINNDDPTPPNNGGSGGGDTGGGGSDTPPPDENPLPAEEPPIETPPAEPPPPEPIPEPEPTPEPEPAPSLESIGL